jgi:hypothetical protein
MSDDQTKTSTRAADPASAAKPSRQKRPPAGQRGAQSVRAKIKARRADQAAASASDRTAVLVMQTSRYLGAHGRPVPRGRVALTTPDRAKVLVNAGEARPATKAEFDAAEASRGVLELLD